MFRVDLSARGRAGTVTKASVIQTRSKLVIRRVKIGETVVLTLLNLNGLGEIVNIDHKLPFIIQILGFLRGNYSLSSVTELLILDSKGSCPNVSPLRTLGIKNLFEQINSNGWILGQQHPGQSFWIIIEISRNAVVARSVPTAASRRPGG